jgi:hypothetical protein
MDVPEPVTKGGAAIGDATKDLINKTRFEGTKDMEPSRREGIEDANAYVVKGTEPGVENVRKAAENLGNKIK